ncbi:hypothetical protein [Peribacillus simplex]|uniref:hypothetical protein n=1 Tax=Peribacillus simplex TaxID=1478 RepID=UPI0024C1E2BA|nr:hypothetical protein [Peribacillus simplex]WHY55513.1 hypothetical protein QNH43_20485 [Peribacillus simplex]
MLFFLIKTFELIGQTKAALSFKTKLIGAEGARLLLRKASPRETPQAQKRRGGSRTARGKRVTGEEINVLILQTPS